MDQQLLDELLTMKQRDVDTRARLLKEQRLYGAYADELQSIHKENAKQLNDIVLARGWPGISLVGLDGCRAAWLVAQHSICTPTLQRKFLALLTKAAEAGDVPLRQVAYLTDRIRFNENRPQVYGTVLDWNEQGELACELADPANVDLRRRAAGLPPLQEDLETHRREVSSEGGKPPDDLEAYRRAGRQWAKSVGWDIAPDAGQTPQPRRE